MFSIYNVHRYRRPSTNPVRSLELKHGISISTLFHKRTIVRQTAPAELQNHRFSSATTETDTSERTFALPSTVFNLQITKHRQQS